MSFYEEMQQIATSLLVEFDQGGIAIVRETPGTGPEGNPGPSTRTTTVLNGAVARGVSFKYVSQNLAAAEDLQVTMRADGIKPEQGDFVTIDGTEHKIKQIIAQPAAGIPAVYVLIVS